MLEAIMKAIESTTMQILGFCMLAALLFVLKWVKWRVAEAEEALDPDGIPTDTVEAEVFVSAKIADKLSELRTKTGAQRTYVFQFHNGSVFTNGSSILRMSCAHESVGNGVSSIMGHCRDVLVSTVREAVEFLTSFKRGDPPVYTETHAVDSGYYKNILMNNGVEATIQYPLYRAAEVIGYIGVDLDNINAQARAKNKAAEDQYQKDLKVKLDLVADMTAGAEYWVNKKGKNLTKTSSWPKLMRFR